jgi:flagellar motor switch protein FliM
VFDFRRPVALSREHVRALQIVGETLARGLTTTFAASLRAVTSISLAGIEQRTYDEYIRTLPNPGVHALLSIQPVAGTAMLQLPLVLGHAMNELMLGGRGRSDQPRRPMTELEDALIRATIDSTLPELRYAFEPITDIAPAVVGLEANPQFAQLAAPADLVIIVAFDARVEQVVDQITLCIPFSSLQPHLEALSANSRARGISPDKLAVTAAKLADHVSDTTIDVSAVFRPLTATAAELVALRPGDTLLLHHPVSEPLAVRAGGVETHTATIGKRNRYLALQIAAASVPNDPQIAALPPAQLRVVRAEPTPEPTPAPARRTPARRAPRSKDGVQATQAVTAAPASSAPASPETVSPELTSPERNTL